MGPQQSPIDINILNVQIRDVAAPLRIDGANQIPTSITVSNNGHAFVIKFNYVSNFKVRFRLGPLGADIYNVDSMHWHWGDREFYGSEHRVNGLQYSAEAHVVAYNIKYGLLDFFTQKMKLLNLNFLNF